MYGYACGDFDPFTAGLGDWTHVLEKNKNERARASAPLLRPWLLRALSLLLAPREA